jgi:hypothetical protein
MPEGHAPQRDAVDHEQADARAVVGGAEVGGVVAGRDPLRAGDQCVVCLLEPSRRQVLGEIRVCVQDADPLGDRLAEVRKSHVFHLTTDLV